jgi:hypothetical protein
VNRLADLLEMERHTPLENSVWLMEYVAKTGGAEHLKLSTRHMNVLQYLAIDLIAFIAVAAFVLYKAAAFLGKRAAGAVFGRGGKKMKTA